MPAGPWRMLGELALALGLAATVAILLGLALA